MRLLGIAIANRNRRDWPSPGPPGRIIEPNILLLYAAAGAIDGQPYRVDERHGRQLTIGGGFWPVIFDATIRANYSQFATFVAIYGFGNHDCPRMDAEMPQRLPDIAHMHNLCRKVVENRPRVMSLVPHCNKRYGPKGAGHRPVLRKNWRFFTKTLYSNSLFPIDPAGAIFRCRGSLGDPFRRTLWRSR